MIKVVDYGLGNIQAFAEIFKRLGIPVAIAKTTDDLESAMKIILPGVGAFDWAMTRLSESGMRGTLDDLVVKRKRPVLGVCVGMQIMALRSDEGELPGLGWIDAEVKRFDPKNADFRLPHMGWNDVRPRIGQCLFRDVQLLRYYFLHSFFFEPANRTDMLASTNYFGEFASAVRKDNVFGVQFHPEKSHKSGIQLLKNFAEL